MIRKLTNEKRAERLDVVVRTLKLAAVFDTDEKRLLAADVGRDECEANLSITWAGK